LDDPSCNSLREKLYENPSFSDIDDTTIQKLIAHLREFCLDRGLKEDYAEAARASELAEKVRIECQARQTNVTARDSDGMGLNDEDFEVRWERQYREFDSESERKRLELAERQRDALEKFEQMWRDEMPRRYRKPSAGLLQIKQIERSMAISGQYERARAMHLEGEKLAAREAEELQATLIRDYRIAKEQKVKAQEAERQKLESDRARLRTVLDAGKKMEGDQRSNRLVVVEQRQIEALKAVRERSGTVRPDYGASVSGSVQSKGKLLDNVIPPLFAPNDPKFVEEEGKRAREKRRAQLEFQKRNAELALIDYTLQPSPRTGEGSAAPEKTEPNEGGNQEEGIVLDNGDAMAEDDGIQAVFKATGGDLAVGVCPVDTNAEVDDKQI
jgi:hypothetical protein